MTKHRTPRAASIDSVAARPPEKQAKRLAATSQPWKKAPRRTSENDLVVDRFANAMKSRFARIPVQGWDDPREYSTELLAKLLGEAMCDGDPVHVGAIAATLYGRRVDKKLAAEHAMRAFLHGSRDDQSSRIATLTAALTSIANMQDRDGNQIEMHRDELRGIARTALGTEGTR